MELSGESSTQRCGIFSIFDSRGVVDGYVFQLLSEMKKSLSRLYIVYSGSIQKEYILKLEQYAEQILKSDLDNNIESYLIVIQYFIIYVDD